MDAVQNPLHDFWCDQDIHGIRFKRENNSIRIFPVAVVIGVAEAGGEAHVRRVFAIDLLAGTEPIEQLVADSSCQLIVFEKIVTRFGSFSSFSNWALASVPSG